MISTLAPLTVSPDASKDVQDLCLQFNARLVEIELKLAQLKGSDGQSASIASNLNMGGNRITGGGSAQSLDDFVTLRDLKALTITKNTAGAYVVSTSIIFANSPTVGTAPGLYNELITKDALNKLLAALTFDDLYDVVITSGEQGDVLYFNGTNWVNLHHGTAGQVWTSGGHGANPFWADTAGSDWVLDSDTWTYVSASRFKVSGKDVTSKFPKGRQLKLTQTTVKYFTVVNSTFSTDTTVTITGGSDYSLVSAAITNPYYSFQYNPAGHPVWYNYTSYWTGFSGGSPYGGVSRFTIIGRWLIWDLYEKYNGYSNTTAKTTVAPVAAKTLSEYKCLSLGRAIDNGAAVTTSGAALASSGSTTIKLYTSPAFGAWTAGGVEANWQGTIMFEI